MASPDPRQEAQTLFLDDFGYFVDRINGLVTEARKFRRNPFALILAMAWQERVLMETFTSEIKRAAKGGR